MSAHNLTNTANALTNAQYSVLSFLEAQPEEWTPTQIAKELKPMPPGTVRWALKKLSEKGKVFYRAEGCTHLYAATIRFTDDFNRLFKAHGTQNRYQIHGLSLKLQGNFANNIPQGGGVVRERFKYYGGGTSFQLSGETFMVWGSFTSRPLDFDRFVLWMAAVDGYCRARGWPVIEGNIKQWRVVQYGFNRDWKRFRNDSPTRCVSLQGFKSWFARVYEKEGLGVLREELHSADERSLEEFVGLCDGSMTSVQVMQHLELVTRSLNSLQAAQVDIIKAVGRLVDRVDALTRSKFKGRKKT
jgi:hypothetical protein